MFRKMPFILVAVILATILLGPILPIELKRALYSISLSIKDIIIFLLPLIIFGLLFRAVATLSSNATKIIIMILALVCCSNFLSTFLSHYIGIWIYNFNLSMLVPSDSNGLTGLWGCHLPKLITNDKSMFAGIFLGIIAAKLYPALAIKISAKIEIFFNKLLKMLVYFIPLFVAGFVIKLQYDGVINVIIKNYTTVFLFIALAQFSYILIAYYILNKCNFKAFMCNVKNMLPAAISGFSTMSSAVSMPLTIIGVENSAKNKDIARAVVPITVNIHLIGDCFAIPILAYAILKSFGMPEPTLLTYLIFTFYFVLAKFSVAAIPGGGIIIMLPILESHLGFNAEMLSFITALYILLDPVITCANVLGNGGFAKMIDNFCIFLDKNKSL